MASKNIKFTSFSKALSLNKSLQILRILRINDGDMLVDYIAGLDNNSSLQELHLSNCDITAKEGNVLYKVLAANSNSLSCLNLSSCPLNTDAAVEIFNGIKKNKTLKELDLSDCGIDVQACYALEDALVNNKTLQVLKLSKNKISEEGAFCLSQGLEKNNTLRKLYIKDCDISDIGTDCILTVLLVIKLETCYVCIPRDTADFPFAQPMAKRGRISCHMFINHFERLEITENGPMMIKSISFTILSPEGEDVLMKWLNQRPPIECLHIDCQLFDPNPYNRHSQYTDSEQQSYYGSFEYLYSLSHYAGCSQQLVTLPFDALSVQYGYPHMQRHFHHFLKALKECKNLKTLHIDTVIIQNYTLSSLGDFLLESRSLTKLHINFKVIDSYRCRPAYEFRESFLKFVSCLEKNTSLEELRLTGLQSAHVLDRKKIQDQINISRRRNGQPNFTFLEPLKSNLDRNYVVHGD